MTHTLLAPKPLNNLSHTRLPSLTTWQKARAGGSPRNISSTTPIQ
jgi:hypothetical protein